MLGFLGGGFGFFFLLAPLALLNVRVRALD